MSLIEMNPQTLFETIEWINYSSMLVALIIGIVRLKTVNRDQLTLLILIGLVTIVEIVGRILWYSSTNNLFLYHFYSVAEFLLLGSLYKKQLSYLISAKYFNLIFLAFVLFAVINTLFFQSLKQFNSNVTLTESLLLIVFSILYFYKELHYLENPNLAKVPMFWINAAIITYFSGSLVLFHVANDLIPVPMKEMGVVWGVHAIFNMIQYTLFAVALAVKVEKKQI